MIDLKGHPNLGAQAMNPTDPPKPDASLDTDFDAIRAIASILAPLELDERVRVLRYLCDRFNVRPPDRK